MSREENNIIFKNHRDVLFVHSSNTVLVSEFLRGVGNSCLCPGKKKELYGHKVCSGTRLLAQGDSFHIWSFLCVDQEFLHLLRKILL